MQRFRWTSAVSVSIPQIDDEHRGLFRLAEDLRLAIEAGAEPARIEACLEELIAHASKHFSHEERLMRATSYPAFAWHKGQHDTVRKRVRKFVPAIQGADPEAAMLLLEFLSGWLRDHTALTDRMMAAYVRNFERKYAAQAS